MSIPALVLMNPGRFDPGGPRSGLDDGHLVACVELAQDFGIPAPSNAPVDHSDARNDPLL
jgi:hypothetical protein